MRTEISNVPLQFIRRRHDYIVDKNGEHKATKLEVTWKCIGFGQPDEIVGLGRRLMKKKYKGAGRRRKYVAQELSVHPSDENKRKDSFRNRVEMEKVAEEIVNEFHIRYALIGFHGLRDLHVFALNWGPTGLALKAYLPNRSNPRRVLVAVVDRVEKQLIAARKEQGEVLLRTMKKVRAARQKANGRLPMHDEIAKHLPPYSSVNELTIENILQAIHACGWVGKVRYKVSRKGVPRPDTVAISFTSSRPPALFEFDLFMRKATKTWRSRKKDPVLAAKKTPPFEALTMQIHRYVQGEAVKPWASAWLRFTSGGIEATDLLGEQLKRTTDDQGRELAETIRRANEILAERARDLSNDLGRF